MRRDDDTSVVANEPSPARFAGAYVFGVQRSALRARRAADPVAAALGAVAAARTRVASDGGLKSVVARVFHQGAARGPTETESIASTSNADVTRSTRIFFGVIEQHAAVGAVPTGGTRGATAGLGTRSLTPILAWRTGMFMGRVRTFGAECSDRTRFPIDQSTDSLVGAVSTGRTWSAVILGDFGLALASHARRGHAEALGTVVPDWAGNLCASRLPAWAVVSSRAGK